MDTHAIFQTSSSLNGRVCPRQTDIMLDVTNIDSN
jgi:hypothetical protein